MSAEKGLLIRCCRDDNFIFLKYLGKGDADGGYTTWDKFEELPDDWLYEPQFGYLCPECTKQFKKIMTEFFNGQLAPCWKLEENK